MKSDKSDNPLHPHEAGEMGMEIAGNKTSGQEEVKTGGDRLTLREPSISHKENANNRTRINSRTITERHCELHEEGASPGRGCLVSVGVPQARTASVLIIHPRPRHPPP